MRWWGEVGAAVAAAGGVLATLSAVAAPLTSPAPGAAASIAVAKLPAPSQLSESLVVAATVRDPFRANRRPADISYDPRRVEQPAAQAGGAPKPPLRLAGFVASTPPLAILDGIPGVEGGRAVRQGDTVGALRVVRVGSGTVRVVGFDTTWTLSAPRP